MFLTIKTIRGIDEWTDTSGNVFPDERLTERVANCSLRGREKRRRETASTFRVSREVGRHELWKLN